jgi:hypothetical protein
VFKHTGNADGTAVYFEVPRYYFPDNTSARNTKSTGYEKLSVAVAMCLNADGNKLRP